MKKLLFEGTATALVTPFKGDGIDFDAMGRLIDMQSEGGVGALVICGTTGEAPTLEDGEPIWTRLSLPRTMLKSRAMT